ncbi:hypothetical protein C7S20_12980 [Christiangramia fulva]|uniref:Glycerophosphoryl diester phosphodiesterase membrane domain-containing protein n=1 Tax=Christiangramia fulva TaxID=2126553 RepID=A0A2R3Z770_9FLAO|nr:hypothetical protein [Christiangramia fulva]AVR46095.1 hypothetical protein C7S20_12980 [Christiangramia fulva]
MHGEFIQFKKERELGEILSIIFKFVRENYKEMGKMLLKFSGPAFLILVAALAYYSWSAVGLSLFAISNEGSGFIFSLIILLIAYLLYVTSITGTIYHSILSYMNNEGQIKSSDVAIGMKSDFGKLLILLLISWILIFAGIMLFLIPGIYIAVPLSLAPAVLVFRRQSLSDSISDCFQLVKNNWWMTFATILCIGLLVYLIGLVFQIPAIIYFVIKMITMAQQGSAADPTAMLGTGYIVISVISSMIQYIVYSIMPIGFAFVYFNLNEKKHFTGTYESIQNLGNNQ